MNLIIFICLQICNLFFLELFLLQYKFDPNSILFLNLSIMSAFGNLSKFQNNYKLNRFIAIISLLAISGFAYSQTCKSPCPNEINMSGTYNATGGSDYYCITASGLTVNFNNLGVGDTICVAPGVTYTMPSNLNYNGLVTFIISAGATAELPGGGSNGNVKINNYGTLKFTQMGGTVTFIANGGSVMKIDNYAGATLNALMVCSVVFGNGTDFFNEGTMNFNNLELAEAASPYNAVGGNINVKRAFYIHSFGFEDYGFVNVTCEPTGLANCDQAYLNVAANGCGLTVGDKGSANVLFGPNTCTIVTGRSSFAGPVNILGYYEVVGDFIVTKFLNGSMATDTGVVVVKNGVSSTSGDGTMQGGLKFYDVNTANGFGNTPAIMVPHGLDANNGNPTDNFIVPATQPVNPWLTPTCNISAVSFGNAGSCNDNGTPANAADDYFTADITVTFTNPPGSGTLDLTGDVLVGGGSLTTSGPFTSPITFMGVRLKADGTASSVTAAFSATPACTFTNAAGPNVASCSTPVCNISSISFGSPGLCNDNSTPGDPSDDYFTVSVTVSHTTAPVSGVLILSGDVLPGGGSLSIMAPFTSPSTFTGIRMKADGTPSSVTATFSDAPSCTLTNAGGPTVASCSVPACNISALTFGAPGPCNDNGTPSISTDDYFTADITISFTNPPGSGTLALTGDVLVGGGSLSASAPFTSPMTFSGVRLKADGTASSVTATFSATPACSFTNAAGPIVEACSMVSGTFDLALTKSISSIPNPAGIGSTVVYTLTVINQGTVDASNVAVSDFIPTGLTLNDPDWTAMGNIATLNTPIALLPAMSQTTVDITFTINNQASGNIINNAEISSATGGTDTDSNPGNGTAGSSEDDFSSAAIEICIIPELAVMDDTICRGSNIDLSTLVISHAGDELEYYTTLSDAMNGANELPSSTVNPTTATAYYIKSVYSPEQPGCVTIKKVSIYFNAVNCAGIGVSGPGN